MQTMLAACEGVRTAAWAVHATPNKSGQCVAGLQHRQLPVAEGNSTAGLGPPAVAQRWWVNLLLPLILPPTTVAQPRKVWPGQGRALSRCRTGRCEVHLRDRLYQVSTTPASTFLCSMTGELPAGMCTRLSPAE